jgi:methylmalonyl-CoA/ethylmalonyl-CoA epimerase
MENGTEPINLKLHHVGMLVADISATRELYQKRFGYDVYGDIIHDPKQTAYVQFLKLPHDQVWLELVSPDRAESRFSNGLKQGLGLHHLCYATAAIENSCADLRQRGMTLIQGPVNAAAFPGRRIAWLMSRDRLLIELVEQSAVKGKP